MAKDKLFRKEALENIGSTKHLEKLLIVVKPKEWVSMLCLAFFALLVIIWSFIGYVPVYASGIGIVVSKKGNLNIPAECSGTVEKIFVKKGDFVKTGQLLLKIKNLEIETELQNALHQKNMVENKQKELLETISRKQKLNKEIFQRKIEKNKENIKILKAKGAESLKELEEEELNLLMNQREFLDLEKHEEIHETQSEVETAYLNFRKAEMMASKMTITSPFNGKILEVPEREYGEVKEGDPLVWIEQKEKGDNNIQVYGYYTTFENDLQKGMEAKGKIYNIDDKKYGYLLLKVKEVWRYPVSADEMEKIFANKMIVDFIISQEGQAPLQALFEAIEDPTTPSGYKWTSAKGPPEKLETGAIAVVNVIITKRHPIQYVFPLIREVEKTLQQE